MKNFDKKVWIPIGTLGAVALTAVIIFTSHTRAANTNNNHAPPQIAQMPNTDQTGTDSASSTIEQENSTDQQLEKETSSDQVDKEEVTESNNRANTKDSKVAVDDELEGSE